MSVTTFGRRLRIVCKVEKTLSTHIAVSNGTIDMLRQLDGQEKLFWLPRSDVKINADGTVTMPEELARSVGLA